MLYGCFCWSMIISILASLIILILSVLLYLKSDLNNALLIDISNNHKSEIIIDFKKDQECDPKDRLISNGFYPGTVKGCKCLFKLKRGTCDDDKDKYCYNVYRTSSFDLNIWRTAPVCVVRQPQSYLSSVKYSDLWKFAVAEDQECGVGLKPCGYLDTVKNIMCVDKFTSCPVSKVEMSSVPDFTNKEIVTHLELLETKTSKSDKNDSTNYSYIDEEISEQTKDLKLDSQNYLVYSNYNKLNSEPIPVEFKVFEGKPCSYSNEYLKNTEGNYKLDDTSEYDYVDECSLLYSEKLHEKNSNSNSGLFSNFWTFLKKLVDFSNNEDYSSIAEPISNSNYDNEKNNNNNKKNNKNNNNTKLFSDKLDIVNIEEVKKPSGFKYDTRYKLIDSTDKYKYYDQNNVLEVVKGLPSYPVEKLSKIDINLYSRAFIGISKKCHASYADPLLVDEFLSISENINWKVIIVITFSSILLLLMIITVCNYEALGKFLTYLTITIVVTAVIYYVLSHFIAISIDERIYDCVDDLFAETLGVLEDNTNQINSYIFKIYVSIILLVVSLIVFSTTLCCLGEQGRKDIFPTELDKVDETPYKRIEDNENN